MSADTGPYPSLDSIPSRGRNVPDSVSMMTMPGRTLNRRLSRRRFLATSGGVAALGLLGACGDDDADEDSDTPAESTQPAQPAATETAPPTSDNPTDDRPSLETMVGQMLMLGFRGTELAPANPIVADIHDRQIGGVILFSYDVPSDSPVRNVESPEQVAALCSALRAEAGDDLLIAIDQEGGRLARLSPDHGFPPTTSAAELGAANDLEATRQAGEAIADTLVAAGINLNLAPVVDVNTNPDNPVIGGIERSFSADPEIVSANAAAFIEGHHSRGVLTALKHFPGHGSSEADSHLGFVDVTQTWDELELQPYQTLIEGGSADLVMAAHVFNSNLDPEYPASLSEATITGMLRGELGFAGPVISDDMGMGAIADNYDFETAVRQAILAGNDVLVYGNNIGTFEPELGSRVFETILALVENGEITSERIAESYSRIVALKQRLSTA
ncbi:MAG TPA: glycoside hydrolase family 3 N-terminal domain-containing protein [Dehalococcoidia bacterium]|nr:glycoside hydrolase family 3 N-terminal domain-containing protein [Dehalococcoidia bacterium]